MMSLKTTTTTTAEAAMMTTTMMTMTTNNKNIGKMKMKTTKNTTLKRKALAKMAHPKKSHTTQTVIPGSRNHMMITTMGHVMKKRRISRLRTNQLQEWNRSR